MYSYTIEKQTTKVQLIHTFWLLFQIMESDLSEHVFEDVHGNTSDAKA